jgi:hypothetical protein
MVSNGASTVIACAALALASLALLDSCGGEPCSGSACACPPADCPDLRTTAADNGKTVRLAVGEWATVELRDHSVPASASSSNPKVISQVGKLKVAAQPDSGPPVQVPFPTFQKIYASFHALKAGSARLTIAYVQCPDATADPCSYEVDVNVVQFPKTEVMIDNVYEQNTVKIRRGEAVRFTAPYENDPLWTVSIDSPNVVKWAVEPIYLSRSLFEAAVTAVSAGTAHVQAGRCSSSAPVCSNPWRLTLVVS